MLKGRVRMISVPLIRGGGQMARFVSWHVVLFTILAGMSSSKIVIDLFFHPSFHKVCIIALKAFVGSLPIKHVTRVSHK